MKYHEWITLFGIIIGFIGIYFICIYQTPESALIFIMGIFLILLAENFEQKDTIIELNKKLKELETKE